MLRHYRRGGLFGRLVKDRYAGIKPADSRAMRELNLLDSMQRAGLPVPAPVGARMTRHGIFYRADLLMASGEDDLARVAVGELVDADPGDVRALLKSHGRLISGALEARANAALSQAGELEGWQRWRADQLREELVAKAEALLKVPEGQRLGGRKLQETLRGLRDQWKTTDQGGQPNHALWKRFDEACTEVHKQVEAWLAQVRQQAEATRAQRMGIIEELKAWMAAHAESTDWKAQLRELHGFSERWREAGHLSEKAFAEIQPLWKDTMHQAHARLEAAQAESLARDYPHFQLAQLVVGDLLMARTRPTRRPGLTCGRRHGAYLSAWIGLWTEVPRR